MQKKKGAKHAEKVDVIESSSSEEESEYEDNDDEDDNDDCKFTNTQEPKEITHAQKILHATCKSLSPPVKEDNFKEYSYAVIYIDPKKICSESILQRWLIDMQGNVYLVF